MNEDDLSRLPPAAQAYIRELEARNRQLGERIAHLEEQFRLAQSKRFAPSSEKLRDRVFDEAEQAAATDPDNDTGDAEDTFALPDTGLPDAPGPQPSRRGRKPLTAHLPRQRIEYDLPEDQKICPCCAHALHRMGEELSEQLHIEVKASVLQHVRFKYACRHCERHAERTPVITAPMPAQPLPGSNASAAMIATVTVGKYVDGTPLYRMAHALARADIEVGRGTLANWIIRPAELHYSRLYEALRRTLLSQALIHGDETTVQVLKESGRAAQSTSYMWVYRSAADCPEPVVLFDYQPGRGQEYPRAFLAGYEGLLMTDGYAAWRRANASPRAARSCGIASSTRLNRSPPPNPTTTPAIPKTRLRCPTRACRMRPRRHGTNADASRCQRTCHASASNTTCPKARRSVRAARTHCTAWAKRSANSCISR